MGLSPTNLEALRKVRREHLVAEGRYDQLIADDRARRDEELAVAREARKKRARTWKSHGARCLHYY